VSTVHSIRRGTSDFSAVWVLHPLMKHMARGVVWEARARDGKRLATFRIAEDGSYANSEDNRVELLEDTAAIGVAHPARMSREERARWGDIFADYEILQPFDQISRETITLSAEDLGETSISRKGAAWTEETIERVERGGWFRGSHSEIAVPFEDGIYGVI